MATVDEIDNRALQFAEIIKGCGGLAQGNYSRAVYELLDALGEKLADASRERGRATGEFDRKTVKNRG